jgi:hypothetical protein
VVLPYEVHIATIDSETRYDKRPRTRGSIMPEAERSAVAMSLRRHTQESV